ncbi:hypothetical protein PR048_030189 [Dryococelus australis]|uniref:V-type proton ATPase subunit S1 n=1 Tax=Dryococelus australis TaxID=614101 RepID=A0ABQ9G893_9NEOP|nr:hypothetical protein PR048_030189 [Dryococelus australis]
MEGLKCACVLASIFLSFATGDHAPALVWTTHRNEDVRDHHSALENITPEKFYHHIKKMTGHGQKSLVIAFFEQTLSLEDFGWHDLENKIAFPQVQSVSSSSQFTNFFTSVHFPFKGLKNFQKDGYDIHHVDLKKQNMENVKNLPHSKKILVLLELDDAKTDEDRPDFLRRHDGIVSEIYSEFVNEGYQVTAIYTGHHSSWVEPEIPSQKHRVRRLLAEETNNTISGTLWKSNDSTVLFYSKSVPYVENDGIQVYLSGQPEVLSVVNDSMQIVQISFANGIKISLQFTVSGGYWSINPITLQVNTTTALLKTYPEIEVPLNFSYHCSQNVEFTSTTGNASLVFESFQVQPFLGELSFGDTYDCVWFFTSVIWSVFFVTLMLGSILVWGLSMLMGIKSMDQFDDPKGKTIQVTSTE